MGIFTSIKNKILRRSAESDYDYGDVKSSVLSAPPRTMPEDRFDQDLPEEGPFGSRLDKEPPFPRDTDFPEFPQRGLAEPSGNATRDYDIMERLNLMEAQLAAIRAQTEAINERLKNIDARLGRRY